MSLITATVAIYADSGTNQVLAREQAAANALVPLPQTYGESESPASSPEDAGLYTRAQ
jgi:hypothetical protein